MGSSISVPEHHPLPHSSVITLSPLLPLYPGVAVTLSMLELASQNMNAGSVRLFFSFVRSLMLGFGLTLGARLIKFVTGEAIEARCPSLGRHFSMWFFVLIVPFSALVCIQLKAHVRQWPMMLATSVVAIMAFHGASQVFSRDMTNAIASFAIGLFANTVARRTNDIAMASILAGIIFLAPGSSMVICGCDLVLN